MRVLWKEGTAKLLAAVLALVIIISILPGDFAGATVKMNHDMADYIWYCRNEVQWKQEGYIRETW